MKAFRDITHKLNYILTARQKRLYFIVMFIAFIGSLCEMVGVSAVLPLMETILTPEKTSEKWYVKLLAHYTDTSDTLHVMTVLGIAIIVIYLLKNLYLMFSSYVQSWYSTMVQKELSIRMTNIFLHSSYLFHLRVNSAILIRSTNQDVVGVFAVFFYMFRAIAEVFTCLAIGVYIVTLDPILAFSLAGLLGTCLLFLFFGLKKLVKFFGRMGQNCEGIMLQYLTQAFDGIKEIMVSNRQKYFIDSYTEAATENSKASKRSNFLNSVPANVYEVVCIGGLIAVVVIRLHMTDDISAFVTKLAVIAVAAFRLFPAVGRLTTDMNAIVYNRPRLDSIYEMVKEINEDTGSRLDSVDVTDAEPLPFNDSLRVENVSWRYPLGQENVLTHLDLEVKKGQSVALIGPSGAGKTTLADVILGLLKPQEGRILLDGTDVYENLPGWARVVGYVPQAVYLTDDTIRANVAFGIYQKDIDDERIWHALEEAQLAGFVRHLEDGLDTRVGEHGVRLSGGQRQRIAIARALYMNPEILVLDEATSALDNDTETAVMEAIDSLHGSKTMIIVAHRLTTIRNCDVIYEIRDGIAHRREKAEIFS